MSNGTSNESTERSIQVRFAGHRAWPTLRWAAAALRTTPLLVVVAIAASSIELFVPEGDPLRWVALLVGSLFVTALAAIIAADVDAGQRRSRLDQVTLAISALPRLAITFLGFLVLLFVGVFLPILLIRILGYLIALVVIVYLVSLFQIIFPAVVLDGNIDRGRTAFREARFLAIGLVVVFAIGRLPISIVSPSPSDPVPAMVLTVWAGLWTGLAALAYAKVYLAQRSRADSRQSTTRGPRNDGWDLSRS